jgi:hypothetical protein
VQFRVRFHVRFAVNRRCDLLYLRFAVRHEIATVYTNHGISCAICCAICRVMSYAISCAIWCLLRVNRLRDLFVWINLWRKRWPKSLSLLMINTLTLNSNAQPRASAKQTQNNHKQNRRCDLVSQMRFGVAAVIWCRRCDLVRDLLHD